MFTGIVETQAVVSFVEAKPGLVHFSIEIPASFVEGLKTGASVAVNGVCLTAVKVSSSSISFDVMQETIDKTTLGALKVADRVNVERSLKVGDEIGGHIVSGHVHGVAKVVEVTKTENNVVVTLEPPAELHKYIFPKGFVALNGVSLTVIVDQIRSENFLGGTPTQNLSERIGRPKTFAVSLIPETLSRTGFGAVKTGDLLNIEVDQQTRTIVDTLERKSL
jgi:riboflavin synthase